MTLSTVRHRLVRYALALLALLPVAASAQTTFTVTAVSPDGSHPNPNPYSTVYAIDGIQGRELFLMAGNTYIFQMDNVPGLHPFYITTSETGGGAAAYTDGVTGNGATGNGQLVFTPLDNVPDTLYYGCMNHPNMGWRIVIGRSVVVRPGFSVSVVTPDGSHPDPNANPDFVFAMNETQGGEIMLDRGVNYAFIMNNVPSIHPFFISTQPAGPGTAAYTDGVTGNGATGTDTLFFNPSESAPDTLYYGCMNHPNMGWRILVVPAHAAGVNDDAANAGILSAIVPNPVRGVAEFTLTPPRTGAVRIALVGADGREVAVVHEGMVYTGVQRSFRMETGGLAAGRYRLQVSGAFRAGQNISVAR